MWKNTPKVRSHVAPCHIFCLQYKLKMEKSAGAESEIANRLILFFLAILPKDLCGKFYDLMDFSFAYAWGASSDIFFLSIFILNFLNTFFWSLKRTFHLDSSLLKYLHEFVFWDWGWKYEEMVIINQCWELDYCRICENFCFSSHLSWWKISSTGVCDVVWKKLKNPVFLYRAAGEFNFWLLDFINFFFLVQCIKLILSIHMFQHPLKALKSKKNEQDEIKTEMIISLNWKMGLCAKIFPYIWTFGP